MDGWIAEHTYYIQLITKIYVDNVVMVEPKHNNQVVPTIAVNNILMGKKRS